jgi:hypothetical protein
VDARRRSFIDEGTLINVTEVSRMPSIKIFKYDNRTITSFGMTDGNKEFWRDGADGGIFTSDVDGLLTIKFAEAP